MNILFVSSEFPLSDNQATGGIGTYLLNITHGLVKQGHDVTVVTKGSELNKYKNIDVVYCNFGVNLIQKIKRLLPFSILKSILNFIEYPLLFSIESSLKINQITKKQNIDIIEGSDFGGELFFYLLLNRKRKPVVLRLHTPAYLIQKFNQEPLTLFYRIIKMLEFFCLKKADSLYSPSNSLALLVAKDIKRPVNKIIPYPFKPLNLSGDIKREQHMVLYVGKLQPKKGVFILAEAMPEVCEVFPQVRFLFVGPDTTVNGKSTRKELKILCQKNNIKDNAVSFANETTKDELYKSYRKATIVVIPSLWENFPNVCLEAMFYGAVVVASNTGGLKEMINGNNGLFFNSNNSGSLAKTIVVLFKNKDLQDRLSQKAQSYVLDKYNINKISVETLNYYQKVIKSFS